MCGVANRALGYEYCSGSQTITMIRNKAKSPLHPLSWSWMPSVSYVWIDVIYEEPHGKALLLERPRELTKKAGQGSEWIYRTLCAAPRYERWLSARLHPSIWLCDCDLRHNVCAHVLCTCIHPVCNTLSMRAQQLRYEQEKNWRIQSANESNCTGEPMAS